MPELVLVTGGSGYIGGWCIAELLKRGYRVRTTVRNADREQSVRDAVASVVDPGDRLSFAVADLTADDGWAAAVEGADYVLHVASPLATTGVKNPDDVIIPARDGTLRVLRAATAAGVKRVVVTSAANAASPTSYKDERISDETLWTDPDDPKLVTYRRSKTLAERSAWDFIAASGGSTELATVLPGAVFGPIMRTGDLGSVEIIARMLGGKLPGVPRIGLEVVDVRDLADIHIRAMTAPEAAGQRFLATGEFVWMQDMARTLHDTYGPKGYRVATRQIPDLAVKLATKVGDPALREIAPQLGRRNRHSTEKAHRLLGWQPRPANQAICACADSLIEHGVLSH